MAVGRGQAYGFVKYLSRAEAEVAISALNGYVAEDRCRGGDMWGDGGCLFFAPVCVTECVNGVRFSNLVSLPPPPPRALVVKKADFGKGPPGHATVYVSAQGAGGGLGSVRPITPPPGVLRALLGT